MNRLLPLVIALALLASVAGVAKGADVVNEDDIAYTLIVTSGEDEAMIVIDPGDSIENVCDKCRIEVEGIAAIDVEDHDVVVIQEGELGKSH